MNEQTRSLREERLEAALVAQYVHELSERHEKARLASQTRAEDAESDYEAA
jgi:hypothetical protein